MVSGGWLRLFRRSPPLCCKSLLRKAIDMRSAHPTARKATTGCLVTGVNGADVVNIDDPHAQAVRHHVEGE
jgi:hypothetical protein